MPPPIRAHERTVNFKKTTAIEQATGATLWQALHLLDLTPDPGINLVDEIEMGGTRHNQVDPTQQVLGLPNPQWSANAVMDLAQIGWFLRSLFGNVSTSTVSSAQQHDFVSGGTDVGLLHMENRLASGLFTFGDSLAVTEMTFNFADEDGSRKIGLAGIGRSVRTPVNAAVSSSPTAAPARAKVGGGIGVVKIGGVNLGNIVGGSGKIANGAYAERYFDDSAWPGAIEMGVPSAVFSPEIRTRSDQYSLLASFDGLTPFALEILFYLSATLSMSITCPQVVANPVTPKPSGNAMSVTPTFMASQTASAPMCTVRLRNAVTAY